MLAYHNPPPPGFQSSNLVVREGKQLLSQSVPVFLGPLLGQELDNLIPTSDELVAVSPDGIRSVGHLDKLGIP